MFLVSQNLLCFVLLYFCHAFPLSLAATLLSKPTRASLRRPEFLAIVGPQTGVHSARRSYRSARKPLLALREQHRLQNAVFCEESFGKNHTIYAQIAYKDVERFRNGSVHESYSLRASPHDILNEPYAGSNYAGNTDKTMT